MTQVHKLRGATPEGIDTLIARYNEAIRTKDTARITAFYAPDIVAFDAIAKLQFKGRDAYKAHWDMCMQMCPASLDMVFEFHEPQISAAGDIGFGHFLVRCGAVDKDGKGQIAWMRGTIGLERRDGEWLITHEHYSAPFDPESQKALFDLEP